MLIYYTWAAAEKALSLLPGGRYVYRGLSLLANAGNRSTRRLGGCSTSYRLIRVARELTPAGGTVIDVGTGWHHHDAFLLYLCGDYKIYLFDVVDKASLSYIRTYLQHLLDHMDEVERELAPFDSAAATAKIRHLLSLPSREMIYRACNFEHLITRKTDTPFLPEHTVDFMVSNCVLTHIPPAIAEPELVALRRMLKPTGYMYMMIGHDDHWAFHDLSANMFNYYRYSDRFYSLLFDTAFEYQNRMVKSEWLPIFGRAGLVVADYWANVTDQARDAIRNLPHIDQRFARYPFEELAAVHSYFLLAPTASSPTGKALEHQDVQDRILSTA